MTETTTPFGRAMTLAAVSGLRAALGPAFLETSQRSPKAGSWVLGALGEMALAKVGSCLRGYRPVMLIPHSSGRRLGGPRKHEEGRSEMIRRPRWRARSSPPEWPAWPPSPGSL